MDISSFIEINPRVMMGKPVIKGTRITVELILESLAAGESPENLLLSYPRLTKEGISAALAFAVEAPKRKKFILLPYDVLAEGVAEALLTDLNKKLL